MKTFKIQDITFACEIEKLDEITWQAKLVHIYKQSTAKNDSRDFIAKGNDEKDAIENLTTLLRQEFLFASHNLTIKDVIYSLVKWLVGSKKWHTIVLRSLVVIICLGFISLFFININNTSSNVFISNIRYLTGTNKNEMNNHIDTGFLSEPFVKERLLHTKKVFWATGVSFRNLRDGNRHHLIELLRKNIEFKLVLLEPTSPLATDSFLMQFSRTARRRHIEETIERFTDSATGILTNHGNPIIHQLYTSNYAPIVPMMRVDDEIYVSYLTHTDKNLQLSSYDGPYIKFNINSPFGTVLRDHFLNMIASYGTKQLYPSRR